MPEELFQLADHIWIFPRDSDPSKVQPNVGVICTATQTVLVDGGNSPRHARRVIGALAEMNAPPISYVIYTHHHWDHAFGGNGFGAPVIAHESCRKFLIESAAKPWSYSFLQEEIRRNPLREAGLTAMGRAIEDWRGFRILIPTITFMHKMRLYLDGVTIVLEHVGGRHSSDSIVVRVGEVLFTGDCYYPPPLHLRAPTDTLDYEMMKSLADESTEILVDGHGSPLSRAEFLSSAVPDSRA